MTMRIAVAVSGRGSNLEALLQALGPGAAARVVLVLSNRADAGAISRAAAGGVPAVVLRTPADAAEWLDQLARHAVDLVVLAGYLKLVPAEVIARYRGRILNIHPALLPAFGGPGMYGRHVHEAVLASGASETGATVHLVDEEYDRGADPGSGTGPGAAGRHAGAARGPRARGRAPAAARRGPRRGGRGPAGPASPTCGVQLVIRGPSCRVR